MERALARLGERLHRRGVVADIHVVCGVAMVLAYDARRATRDLDAVFEPHGVVVEEAHAVATELGLSPYWLNDQASVYVSRTADDHARRVFDHPGLRVSVASPEHLLAMKAIAGRRYADQEDLSVLVAMLGLSTVDEVELITSRVFPDEPLTDRSRLLLADVLEARHGSA
jgi:hypothetical protein